MVVWQGCARAPAPPLTAEGSMAQADPADLPELSLADAHDAVVWRPSPDRRRLVLRWTLRCLVAGAVVAGAWSLRDRYPRIDLSVTGPAKPAQATRAHVDQPVVSKPKERSAVQRRRRGPCTHAIQRKFRTPS